ncbi:MAG: penicillin-binding protein 2 [Thermoleophilia bacterium]|nr:penicillin-binding protein 2 [Thermoleophilia bacterium]
MRIEPVTPRHRRLSGTALRVAILGGIGVALFAMLFFRLWSLQVVTGDRYLAEANDNQTREVRVLAPRGRILDRDGNVLVDNRTSMALQLDPLEIPSDTAERRKFFTSIGEVIGRSQSWVRKRYRFEIKDNPPGSPVTLVRDVGDDIVYYLQEHQSDFPEIQINRVFVRRYPEDVRAAHLLGSVGEVTAEDLKSPEGAGLQAGDTLGKAGIEQQYDAQLRGEAGLTRVQVDSRGRIKGQLDSTTPEPGEAIRLTLDPDVQAAGESALLGVGLPAAFVALDVNDGEVLGMGSNPTFDPDIFTRPLTPRAAKNLWDEDLGAPMFNRAIAGAYPVGSTYKPITAVAGLAAGKITPSTVVDDGGKITISDQTFTNAGSQAHGPVDLRRAIEVSSDVYFYSLGAQLNGGEQLQHWSSQFGIGRPTGIDLPGESEGLLPTPEWRNELFAAGETDRPWAIGDNVQLAIGQGDLQADPLQMATAYAALGNGGTVYKPRLVIQGEDSAGRVVREYESELQRQIDLDPGAREAIMDGLHAAAQQPDGTSYGVFGGFPIPVAGKTGTAERPPHGDQSWYVALAPYPDPRVAVAVTVERGGFGSDTAAPVALQILSAYFDRRAKSVSGGSGNVE